MSLSPYQRGLLQAVNDKGRLGDVDFHSGVQPLLSGGFMIKSPLDNGNGWCTYYDITAKGRAALEDPE